MTVLVTGGAGYIGSHTVRALRGRGREVVVLDNLGNGHEASLLGAPLVVGDIDDGILVEKLVAEYEVDACIHFAALEGRRRVHGAAGSLLPQQRGRLEHAARRAAAVGCRARSCSPRRPRCTARPTVNPIVEDAPLHPESVYGETKWQVERMLGWFDATVGLRSVSLRYFNAAGASSDGAIGEDFAITQNLVPVLMKALARPRPGAAGVRRRLPDARRHRRPRLRPRRGSRRGPRARRRVPRPGRRDDGDQPRHAASGRASSEVLDAARAHHRPRGAVRRSPRAARAIPSRSSPTTAAPPSCSAGARSGRSTTSSPAPGSGTRPIPTGSARHERALRPDADADLAAELAAGGRPSSSSSCAPRASIADKLGDEGDRRVEHLPARRASPPTGPATPSSPRRAPTTWPACTPTASGSSTRSTAPASSPSSPAPTGPSTWPCGSTATSPSAPSPCPRRASSSVLRRRQRCRRRTVGRCGSSSAAPAHRPSPRPSPTGSAPSSSPWARPAPRPRPSCSARPTSTSTAAASGSGTRPPRWPSAGPPGCTPPGSTARPLVYNQAKPWLPDLLICRPELADERARGHRRSPGRPPPTPWPPPT